MNTLNLFYVLIRIKQCLFVVNNLKIQQNSAYECDHTPEDTAEPRLWRSLHNNKCFDRSETSLPINRPNDISRANFFLQIKSPSFRYSLWSPSPFIFWSVTSVAWPECVDIILFAKSIMSHFRCAATSTDYFVCWQFMCQFFLQQKARLLSFHVTFTSQTFRK